MFSLVNHHSASVYAMLILIWMAHLALVHRWEWLVGDLISLALFDVYNPGSFVVHQLSALTLREKVGV